MEIEIVTTKKKLTKSTIKQFELADWKYINFFFKSNGAVYPGDLFRVNGVYNWPVIIFKGHNGQWYQFALHSYTISARGNDCYVNNARHLFINDKDNAELFLENVKMIENISRKVII